VKKTVGFVTNWYPTEDNPYRGVFFKEQAIALKDYLNFIIVHYEEEKGFNFKQSYKIANHKPIENITEYTVVLKTPIYRFWVDYIKCVILILKSKKPKDYLETQKIIANKKIIERIYEENFKGSFDVLYCINAQNDAHLLEHISNISGKPYIVSEHGPVPWLDSHVLEINKKAIENAHLFLAISNDKIRQMLMNNIKLPEIKYIGNLVDENTFLMDKKENSDVKTIVIVASNSHYRNYDLFIKTINKLTEITKQDFKVKVVGYKANKGYSKNSEELEKKMLNSKFADKAILIPEIEHNKIVDIYNSSDVFVMTSCQEGQPVSALEAACCGLPIYSTRCGGVEDYVDEKIGRLYNVDDYGKLAEGLKDFIEGETVYDSSKIRESIINKYGKTAFTKNFLDGINMVTKKEVS